MAGMASMRSRSGGGSLLSLTTPSGSPKFVSELSDKYLCVHCHNVLRNAVQTSCGHRMCEDCVRELLSGLPPEKHLKCPANEEDCEEISLDSLNPDSSARRDVLKLMVYCTHEQYGCQAKVKWKDLEEHVKSCEFTPSECPNKRYGCRELVTKLKLREHESQLCNYRRISCSTCGDLVPFAELKDHENQLCPKAMISCPHNCGMSQFPREELDAHFRSCPARPFKCVFAEYGCIYEGSQHTIECHVKENVEEHLKLLVEGISRKDLVINELRKKHVDLLDDVDQLKAKLVEKDNLMRALTLQVEDNQGKLRKLQGVIAKQHDRIESLDKKSSGGVSMEQLDKQAADILVLKEAQATQQRRLVAVEQTKGGKSSSSSAQELALKQVKEHEKTLGLYNMRLAEIDLRFQILETASYNGVLIWKIRDYARRKQEAMDGQTYSLYSQPFYTSRYGYKMCARVYLNGDGLGKNTHMSLFFVIMRGDCDALLQWPFKQKVSLMLLDQNGHSTMSDTFRPDPNSSSFKRPTTNMNIASGCPMFVSQSVLHSGNYIKDDTLFIKVVVDTTGLESL